MNIYWLKRFRKEAQSIYRIRAYNYEDNRLAIYKRRGLCEWEQVGITTYEMDALPKVKADINLMREKYIHNLVRDKRNKRINKKLAKL